ncbi:MAG: hypothetical protein RLY31_2719 [Bacteroidota bacterium]|jgi:DNA-binding response OmpR family regulator
MTNFTKRKILIIEDHDSIRFLLGSILSKSYEVVTKRDGLEGMAWLVSGNLPDLILLDVTMPRLNGTEFLRNIRQNALLKGIPVIIVSGNDGASDIEYCHNLGIYDYLTKPFNPIKLKEKIEAVLRQYHARAILN